MSFIVSFFSVIIIANFLSVVPDNRPSTSSSILGKTSYVKSFLAPCEDKLDSFRSNFSKKPFGHRLSTSSVDQNIVPPIQLKRLNRQQKNISKAPKTSSTRTQTIGTQTSKNSDFKLIVSMENGVPRLVVNDDDLENGVQRRLTLSAIKENITSIDGHIFSLGNDILNQSENISGRRNIETVLESLVSLSI